MDVQALLMSMLVQLPARVPLLIALGVALTLVLQKRAADPPAVRLAAWGFGVMLAAQLLAAVTYPLLQAYVTSAALPFAATGLFYGVIGVGLAMIEATGLILLALAVVRRRR
ncbi:hypothetical protein [Luteimonas sp. RC10]|uniref:hypothetical protein n=1 Tax=Luteimonas sp. RC10 TaxID=2587035 RepID=UPI001607DE0F|nr:hypothetical protein [Luteimonas sp. RC10]MBB3342339.1 hypothetical protein [Luteimonas sp. RC10]